MRTQLPIAIKTIKEAETFLTELIDNNESYHPEDNAHDIIWSTTNPTIGERTQLNNLMDQIYELDNFDPCEFILNYKYPR